MKFGLVSLIGRPNAGKSTLLNRIIGRKVAIVSDKPQTTRSRVLAVKNYPGGQVVFVDTPGVHKPAHRLNVRMVDAALEAMQQVDVLALVVDASAAPGAGDRYLLKLVAGVQAPVVLVLNKIDRIAKPRLLPMLDAYRRAHAFAELVPVSARDGTNVERLETLLLAHLPEGEPMYPPGYLTDQPERFLAGEIVREQVLQLTREELPFSTAVVVDRLEDSVGPAAAERKGGGDPPRSAERRMALYCTILVERRSQKGIVVGKGGSMIKAIGSAARAELERHFGARVRLELHVAVRSRWRNDDRTLDEIGLA